MKIKNVFKNIFIVSIESFKIFILIGLVIMIADLMLREMEHNPTDILLDVLLPWRWFR